MIEYYTMPVLQIPYLGHITPIGILVVLGMVLFISSKIENELNKETK